MEIRTKINLVDEDGRAFMGPGTLYLLEAIDDHRSIAAAARAMGLSYTKAHRMLNQLEQSAKAVFLNRKKGGSTRGGTELTSHAQDFIRTYKELERRIQALTKAEFQAFAPTLSSGGEEGA